jgi:hypothetical protein
MRQNDGRVVENQQWLRAAAGGGEGHVRPVHHPRYRDHGALLRVAPDALSRARSTDGGSRPAILADAQAHPADRGQGAYSCVRSLSGPLQHAPLKRKTYRASSFTDAKCKRAFGLVRVRIGGASFRSRDVLPYEFSKMVEGSACIGLRASCRVCARPVSGAHDARRAAS